MSAALIILIIVIILITAGVSVWLSAVYGEKATNIIIFIICVFITCVCFINTGMLWSITPEADDAVDLSSGYRNFVSGTNLFFGILFLFISGYFLLTILSVYNVKVPGWLNKFRSSIENFATQIGLQNEKDIADMEALKLGKKLLSEDTFDKEFGVSRKYGKTVMSCPSDKDTVVPEIIGAPKIDSRITFGDFKFKSTKQLNMRSTSPKPLDSLKEYYISQKLKK